MTHGQAFHYGGSPRASSSLSLSVERGNSGGGNVVDEVRVSSRCAPAPQLIPPPWRKHGQTQHLAATTTSGLSSSSLCPSSCGSTDHFALYANDRLTT